MAKHELKTASVGLVTSNSDFFLQIIFADTGKTFYRKITRDAASKLIIEEEFAVAEMTNQDIEETSDIKTKP